MFHEWSEKWADRLKEEAIISESDSKVVAYGFELTLAILASILGFALLVFMTDSLLEMAGFMIGFMGLRSVAGGFHAKNHLQCQMLSYGIYVLFLLMHRGIDATWMGILLWQFALIAVIIIFVVGPVDHPNKPLSKKRRVHFKRLSRKWVVGLMIIVLLIKTLDIIPLKFLESIIFGTFTAALFIGVATIQRRQIHET